MNLLDIVKNKLNLKSEREKMDERFANGTEVAAAPLALIETLVGTRPYMKRRMGIETFDNSPRDIIRTSSKGIYPYDIYKSEKPFEGQLFGPDMNGHNDALDYSQDNYIFYTPSGRISNVLHDGDKKIARLEPNGFYDQYGDFWEGRLVKNHSDDKIAFDDAYNKVVESRLNNNLMLNDFFERRKERRDMFGTSLKSDMKSNGHDYSKMQHHYADFDLDDWKNYVAARNASKDAGHKLGIEFAKFNAQEKQKYKDIAYGVGNKELKYGFDFSSKINDGIPGDRYFALKDFGDIVVPESQMKKNQEWENAHPVEVKRPQYALGGQNAMYLSSSLDEKIPQTVKSMISSAKPIHYDKNGNPYVRGFTWTQTGNVPKIMDPNGGYLASVGADAAEYHPNTKGHWMSEGWGNPMDKNYVNGVAPGEVNFSSYEAANKLIKMPLNDREQDAVIAYLDGVDNGSRKRAYDETIYNLSTKYGLPLRNNFDELLLETRYPLKFYNKAPHLHQPNHGEKVTIMGAGSGAKDVHTPVNKQSVEVTYGGDLSEVAKQDLMLAENEIKRLEAKSDSLKRLGRDTDSIDYEILQKKSFIDMLKNTPQEHEIIKKRIVSKPVETAVHKIATPSRFIHAYGEDNMPNGWSMRDRSNGGETIAGWHPNKEWADTNAAGFVKLVKEGNYNLYKQLVDEYKKETGTDALDSKDYSLGRSTPAFNRFLGKVFVERPDLLKTLRQKTLEDFYCNQFGLDDKVFRLANKARFNIVGDNVENGKYKTPYDYIVNRFNVPRAGKFALGHVSRGERPNDSPVPENIARIYKQANDSLYINGDKLTPLEKERLKNLKSYIERMYGPYYTENIK